MHKALNANKMFSEFWKAMRLSIGVSHHPSTDPRRAHARVNSNLAPKPCFCVAPIAYKKSMCVFEFEPKGRGQGKNHRLADYKDN